MSGFCYLSSGADSGSSHAIGACAPFTVWAVDPLLGGKNNNNRKKKPYKNNRDPTCWLGPLTRTASSYAGVQEVCISPAQRDKKCAFRRQNAKHVFKTLPWTCGYKGFDCGRSSRSQCRVFAAKFCRRYTISSFIAPPNGEIFRNFYRTTLRLAPTCL